MKVIITTCLFLAVNSLIAQVKLSDYNYVTQKLDSASFGWFEYKMVEEITTNNGVTVDTSYLTLNKTETEVSLFDSTYDIIYAKNAMIMISALQRLIVIDTSKGVDNNYATYFKPNIEYILKNHPECQITETTEIITIAYTSLTTDVKLIINQHSWLIEKIEIDEIGRFTNESNDVFYIKPYKSIFVSRIVPNLAPKTSALRVSDVITISEQTISLNPKYSDYELIIL